jgi:hypothetical protein
VKLRRARKGLSRDQVLEALDAHLSGRALSAASWRERLAQKFGMPEPSAILVLTEAYERDRERTARLLAEVARELAEMVGAAEGASGADLLEASRLEMDLFLSDLGTYVAAGLVKDARLGTELHDAHVLAQDRGSEVPAGDLLPAQLALIEVIGRRIGVDGSELSFKAALGE